MCDANIHSDYLKFIIENKLSNYTLLKYCKIDCQ